MELAAQRRLTIAIGGMLVAVFCAVAFLAVRTKAPTVDEPIHALSGYLYLEQSDFRYDVDNPPLWKFFAMIPQRIGSLKAPPPSAAPVENPFLMATQRLFQTPGNDGAAFINRSRAMMLIIGALLAAAIMTWSWQIVGAVAAGAAGLLYCLDPSFLAHAPLIKSDVTVAFCVTCAAWMTWRVGRRVSVWNVAALCLACGAATVVKYNGIFAPLIPLFLLPIRALLPSPWLIGNRALRTLRARLLAAAAIIGIGVAGCVLIIWASYEFRYLPSPSGSLDVVAEVRALKQSRYLLNHESPADPQQLDAAPTPLVARAALVLDAHLLLPQGWLWGLVSIYHSSTTTLRESYLLGEISATGWWYFFPLAILFKTPIITLLLIAAAAVMLLLPSGRGGPLADRWLATCLFLPPAAYLGLSMAGNVDVGIRHILPIYPPLFVIVGLAAERLRRSRPRVFRAVAALAVLALAVESLGAYPHYISYFNAIARPYRLSLLSDSNFDWGQDLTYVRRWQLQHPDTPIYLAYWGPVDPQFYGIRYTNLPGGFAFGHDQPPLDMSRPGVVMISATLLQGVNVAPQTRDYYATLRNRPPDDLVGDSIYLYRWQPAP
jgi:4-amino-4-deoxy-L-arabinose transferase-like glycosyltransferase